MDQPRSHCLLWLPFFTSTFWASEGRMAQAKLVCQSAGQLAELLTAFARLRLREAKGGERQSEATHTDLGWGLPLETTIVEGHCEEVA